MSSLVAIRQYTATAIREELAQATVSLLQLAAGFNTAAVLAVDGGLTAQNA
ncbi:MAG: hypothetical protein ACRDTK_02580 [Mycobacterium sp.]